MKLQNKFIYDYAEHLYSQIVDNKELKFPAKVNYSIQKNFKNLFSIYQEINEEKENICKEYSTKYYAEEHIYVFEDEEKRVVAEKELNGLMSIEQEINIIKFKLEDLGDINLSFAQMDALMFMIEDDN